jgi:hypothetical protein
VDLVDFPVLVAFGPEDLGGVSVLDVATDLRFHDPDTDVDLPFDVERWDASGESLIWVRVPRIDARSTTDGILMYFGAGVATVPRSRTEVWSSYDLIFHGGTDENAAGSSYTPTRTPEVTFAEGRIGNAVQLNGPGDHRVTFEGSEALLDRWPSFTLELWIYPDYASPALGGIEPAVLENAGSVRNGRLFSPTPEGPLLLQFDIVFANGPSTTYMYVPHRIWSHVIYAFNGETLLLYRNGTFANFDAVGTTTLSPSTNPLELGSRDRTLTGMIDELRVSRAYRGPDWIFAQYLSMSGSFARIVRKETLL